MSTIINEDKKPKHIIKNFTVGKTLGKGTFGKVKQGTHTQTGELVINYF